MICPFCGVKLPTLTPRTPASIRHTVTQTLRAHSVPHKRIIGPRESSPEDLGDGSWVLAPNGRVRVWQAA